MKLSSNPPDSESFNHVERLFAPLGKRACPIYGRCQRGYELIGTAVPMISQKYAALLTAAHVLHNLDHGHIVIGGSRKLLRFPAGVVKFAPRQPAPAIDVDLAAVALPAEAVTELSEFYEFTGPSDLADFEEYSKLTLYGFVGCPYTKNRFSRHKPDAPRINSYFYVVREFAQLANTEGKRPATHVAFHAPVRSAASAKGLRTAPDPHGISGCGVWKIKLDKETGQNSRPQLVGIGIEYSQGVFVATRIGAGTIAIAQLWKNLEQGKIPITTLELRENS